MASAAIAKYKDQIAAKTRKIADLSGGSVARAGGNAAIALTAAFVGGVADEYAEGKLPVEPSIGTGLIVGTAGVFMKSPRAIQAATGLLAPAAHDLGRQAAKKMAEKA